MVTYSPAMETVFRALSDPSRRILLDKLYERDGQTLTQLAAHLEMSRFGVMKHLKLLEAADLVLTRRVGREKHHYLNPVPIRQIEERWIGKFARPWVSALTGLKQALEEPMSDAAPAAGGPRHVYQIYIRCTAEQLWRAITDGALTQGYFGECTVESDWVVGSSVAYRDASGAVVVDGDLIALEPERLLRMTWREREPGYENDPPSRVSWEIEPQGAVCKLTIVHDGFGSETKTYDSVGAGWPAVLSGLKTLLETGQPLALPH